MSMRFEWDPVKAASNFTKHRVSFAVAVRVFYDPFALVEQDRIENGEHRWQTLGMVEGCVLLLVAHTVNDENDIEVIRIISARRATSNERKVMRRPAPKDVQSSTLVTPLTTEQEMELFKLQAMSDQEIDVSDIPPLGDGFWKNAVINPFYKPTKTSTTLRIDSDVLAWLRTGGKGYQSRINAILRREMLSCLK